MGADEKNLSIGSGLFMIVAGIAAMGYFGGVVLKQSSASSWPTTTARIVTSRIVVESDIARNVGNDLPHADIAFQYSVDGVTHQSTELWFDSEPAGTLADMQTLVAEYPKGRTIEVFYNPNDPSQAVVNPQKNAMLAKVSVGFGIGSLLIGTFVLWGGLAAKPKVQDDFGDWDREPSAVGAPEKSRQVASGITWVPQSAPKAATHPKREPPKPAPPKGPRHWAVRAIAGIVGLPVLLMFGAVTIMFVQQTLGEKADHPLPVMIISTAISGGMTLFGLWLTSVCFIRRGKQPSAT